MSLSESIYNSLFKYIYPVYRCVAQRFMDVPPAPEKHAAFRTTVVKVESIGENLKRITLSAPELKSYQPFTMDEYFGLILPKADQDLIIPHAQGLNIRAELNEIPEDERPDLRWYTVREHNKARGEVIFDAIVHGDSGPATRWAQSVTPGKKVGFRTMGGAYQQFHGMQLLVADATAIPALMAIMENLSDEQLRQTSVLAVAEDRQYYDPKLEAFGSKLKRFTLVETTLEQQTQKVEEALRSAYQDEYAYAWLCGESSLVKSARSLVVKDWGLDKKHVMFSGYWRS